MAMHEYLFGKKWCRQTLSLPYVVHKESCCLLLCLIKGEHELGCVLHETLRDWICPEFIRTTASYIRCTTIPRKRVTIMKFVWLPLKRTRITIVRQTSEKKNCQCSQFRDNETNHNSIETILFWNEILEKIQIEVYRKKCI